MKFEHLVPATVPRYWHPCDGEIGDVIALDTETTLIVPGQVPQAILTSACANNVCWIVKNQHLKTFLEIHKSKTIVMFNAAFDMAVIKQETGFDFDGSIRSGCLFDVALLYRLYRLAITGQSPAEWSLALVSKQLIDLDLDKDEGIRKNFGEFLSVDGVNYQSIPTKFLTYAAADAYATLQIYKLLLDKILSLDSGPHLLSHKIQLMGAWALARVEMRGLAVDRDHIRKILIEIERVISACSARLDGFGLMQGKPGVQLRFENICKRLELDQPRTASGGICTSEKALSRYSSVPFIAAYINFRKAQKLRDVFKRIKGDRVHTRFNSLLNTGRVSSSNPNIQNLPRLQGIRESFVPSAGFVFLIIDYRQLELITLAQVCFDLYKNSKMAEILNEGIDLHLWFAEVITGRKLGKNSPQRQWAKAANFGFPGGLGIKAFIAYAAETYGIKDMTVERATDLKNQWLAAFPEMRLYLEDSFAKRFESLPIPPWCRSHHEAATLFRRIIGGERHSKTGTPYKRETLGWAFIDILPKLAPHHRGVQIGSQELLSELLLEDVITRTGRIRAKSTYCAARNTRFQGLAADGAKIALYRLERAGYRTVAFVHDEFVIEIPVDANFNEVGENIKSIICNAMRAVTPDVKVDADWFVADRWYKKGELVKDNAGIVGVFSEHSIFNLKGLA